MFFNKQKKHILLLFGAIAGDCIGSVFEKNTTFNFIAEFIAQQI